MLLPASYLERFPEEIDRTDTAAKLRFRRFTDTSSTKLEIQTLLWAAEQYRREFHVTAPGKLRIYTDSQCLVGLAGRRAGLEARQFLSRGSGRLLANAALYQAWYTASDALDCELVKVAGHSRSCSGNAVQQIFSQVDQAARKALRCWLTDLAAEG